MAVVSPFADETPKSITRFITVSLLLYAVAVLILLNWKTAWDHQLLPLYVLQGIMFITAAGAMLGGMAFNFRVWSFILGQNCCLGLCATAGCFLPGAFILFYAIGTASPVLFEWEFMEIEPIHYVDLCSTAEWKDFKGGIYFEGGALTQDDSMPPVIKLDIQQCIWVEPNNPDVRSGYWTPCFARLRPVFTCDPRLSKTCTNPRACAWAITASEASEQSEPDPPKAPDCGTPGVCGMVYRMNFFMPFMSANSTSMKTFHQLLETLGRRFPGSLTADSPLLILANPAELKRAGGEAVERFYKLLIVYVPLGAVLGLLVAAARAMASWQTSESTQTDTADDSVTPGSPTLKNHSD
ncbi:unnamed protein product [Symbiodinium natans]|uniref:Uncharacterized protein n=1 Tax=Symbiodinium natans TaxID=878477 RepID=A0A812TE41_9DINO|nr:unnamed protein product [Symbiodinium natans]